MTGEFSSHQEFKPDKIKLRVDADLIVDRINIEDGPKPTEEKNELKNHYEGLLQQYSEMELTLPIEDEPMKRICQVLTNNGFITTDSCEGHGDKLPNIFFECEDQQLLREIAHVLSRASYFKRFPWHAEIRSGDPYLNPNSPLFFKLSPSQERGVIDPKQDREELLRDLDIIGICLLDHFNSIYEEEDQQ